MGYGDFGFSQNIEYVWALLWMIIGVNFYSFTIGNVTSLIQDQDNKSAELNQKLNTMANYAERFNLPLKTQTEIKNYFTQRSKLLHLD